MLILFDHGTPRGIARALTGHTVATAYSRGWDKLSNGDLLDAAEKAAFDLLLTTDRRIRYQQNLSGRRIALVVLTGTTNGRACGCISDLFLQPSMGPRQEVMSKLKFRSWTRHQMMSKIVM